MELSAYIADLEARAALIPSREIDFDLYDQCAHCKKPLPKNRVEFRRNACKDYCLTCYEMLDVINGRSHFADAEREYQERMKRIKLLRSDSDYLGGK